MELWNFSILFKFEFIRSHYYLLCVPEFVNLVFLLGNYSLLILVATVGLVIGDLAHAKLKCVKRIILPFALLTKRVCSSVSKPHNGTRILAYHLVFDQTFISLTQLSKIRMFKRLRT